MLNKNILKAWLMIMNESLYEKSDLIRMTNEPLQMQYQRIIAKIMEAMSSAKAYGEEIVICFSGGKDSALVLDMFCEINQHFYNNPSIKVAWANTTNETVNMTKYIPWFIDRCEQKYGVAIRLHEVKPLNKDNILTVLKREGLPFVSKMVASTLRKVTTDMERNNIEYSDIKNLHCANIKCRDALREMGLSDTTVLALTGWSCRQNAFGKAFVLPTQWMPLLDIKRATGLNIRFTEKCCDILKKEPIKRLDYKYTMTGEQAVESKNREQTWLKKGCNYRLPDGSYKSKPLGAVSADTVLYAIKHREIPLCKDYGEIIFDCEKQCYKCTRAGRTGCSLCGFGIKFDRERFVRLQETDPSKVSIAFKPLSQGGLGYKELCEYSNEYCNTNIVIPR